MRKLILLALLIGGSAAAVPPTGMVIDPTPNAPAGDFQGTPEDAARLLNGVAKCIATTRSLKAQQILALPFQSEEQNKAIGEWVGYNEDCMREVPGELRFAPPALAAGLAEGLFLRSFARKSPDWIAKRGATVKPRDQAEDLALCLVVKEPRSARALIDTEPTSTRESEVIVKLVPSLGTCVPQGMTASFTPSAIRMFAAVGLYLAANGPAGQQPPSG